MFFTLYTTRLILSTLGTVDYGIYGVVGGAINMLGFFSASLAVATQRFMSFEEGANNIEKKHVIFNVSVILHHLIAVVTIVFLCGFYYFFFDIVINIPENRVFAAKVVYFAMLLSVSLTIISVPYDAIINSHENMLYYSIVGVFESIAKFAIAIVLCNFNSYDPLISYGLMTVSLSIIVLCIMRFYCNRKYEECKFSPKKYFDRQTFTEIAKFASWRLVAQSSSMIGNYGIGLVLNHFFGAVINAANAIAAQVITQLQAFSSNMMKAVNPAIVKSEGAEDRANMLNISMYSCKYSFLLFAIFVCPVVICLDHLLKIWLVDVPEWAYFITLFGLIRTLNEVALLPLDTSIGATGKIRGNSIMSMMLNIIPLPLLLIIYNLFNATPWVFIFLTLFVWGFVFQFKTLYFAAKECNLQVLEFLKGYLLKPYIALILSVLLGISIRLFNVDAIILSFVASFISFIVFAFFIWYYCFDVKEKKYTIGIKTLVINKILE